MKKGFRTLIRACMVLALGTVAGAYVCPMTQINALDSTTTEITLNDEGACLIDGVANTDICTNMSGNIILVTAPNDTNLIIHNTSSNSKGIIVKSDSKTYCYAQTIYVINGTFSGSSNNADLIIDSQGNMTGGKFSDGSILLNYGTISGGEYYYKNMRNYNLISGGTFGNANTDETCELYSMPDSKVTGGIFLNDVVGLKGSEGHPCEIDGGIFNCSQRYSSPSGSIGVLTNYNIVMGGTFICELTQTWGSVQFQKTTEEGTEIGKGIFVKRTTEGKEPAYNKLTLSGATIANTESNEAYVMPGTTVTANASSEVASTEDRKWTFGATEPASTTRNGESISFSMPSSETTLTASAIAKPTITVPDSSAELTYGYSSTSISGFTVGADVTSVSVTGNDHITWDADNNALNVAAGLTAGEYTVTLTATNGITTSAGVDYVVKVNKMDQEFDISSFNNASTVYLSGDSITRSVTLTKGDGNITYTSSDEKVVTVSSSGALTIVGGGTATITATASETDLYKQKSVTCQVTVDPADLTVDVTGFKNVTKTYGPITFEQHVLTVSTGTKSFSSSDLSVATVDADGTVKILGTGTATITETIGTTANYKGGSVSYTLTVTKADQTIGTVSFQDVDKTYEDSDFTQTVALPDDNDGTVEYASDDTAVATVDKTTGQVHIVGKGTATITASVTGAKNYNDDSVSYIITVKPKKTTVLNGDQQSTVKDSVPEDGITVRFEADVDGVTKVKVNGEELTRYKDYNLKRGSTIVELTKSYLDSLPTGDYTLEVDYGDDMYGQSLFSIKPAEVQDTTTEALTSTETTDTYKAVNTSDHTSVYGWMAALIVSLGLVYVGMRYGQRKN